MRRNVKDKYRRRDKSIKFRGRRGNDLYKNWRQPPPLDDE